MVNQETAQVVNVYFCDQRVGAALFDTNTGVCDFQYDKAFVRTGLELSPLKMPLSDRVYSFHGLDPTSFHGLPGLLADSLPDDFGSAVLNAWVAKQGRDPENITPIERLQYTGQRGMGALEFRPALNRSDFKQKEDININELVEIAQKVLDERERLSVTLDGNRNADEEAMLALLSVGTSAGGARPKAVLAFNKDFTKVRSGQGAIPEGFTHYLMKFDGVAEHSPNKQTFGDPLGYSAMEYVYHLMAIDCGIIMEPCHLLDEGPRRHFLTRRFDRKGNEKIHTQSLFALEHITHNLPGHYSYAELFMTAKKLKLPKEDAIQLLKRLVFNIVARNHDDHSKNFAFILNDKNQWRLAPAFDLAYSYRKGSKWVDRHWMSLNGKRDNFTLQDFYSLTSISPIFTRPLIKEIVDNAVASVSNWSRLAKEHEVPTALAKTIGQNLRLHIS